MRGLVRMIARQDGQMAVELAVLMPVIVIVALVVFNLGRYVGLCAVFDRAAMDVVIAKGVSPRGTQSVVAAVDEVTGELASVMAGYGHCEVSVKAEPAAQGKGGMFTTSPLLTRFRCSLVYRPWPSAFVLAGIRYDSPLMLHHERDLVVDRHRSGVVV